MSKNDHLRQVLQSGVVAVLRAKSGERLAEAAETLLAAGITVMEVTFTVPGAVRILERLADQLGDRILLGAGTVLDPETARIAILAGAEFIVSPSTNLDVIKTCRRYDKLIMPGALTPTEIVTAWEAGADIVKVFPCDAAGPQYIKSLRGPLPQVRMMPTGGVNLDTAADFIKAGACSLGIGSALLETKALETGDFARIESLARQYVQIVKEARQP